VEIQELAEAYQAKTDEELLRLALEASELTPEARMALSTELSRRGIDRTEQLTNFREYEERRKEEAAKHTGSLFIIHPIGIGQIRFGKADLVYVPTTDLEQFKTTIFDDLFWFPLITTGTFLVRKKRSLLSRRFTVVRRLPLDWKQVRRVWLTAISVCLSLMIALGIWAHFS
jgi:hypothetical protein